MSSVWTLSLEELELVHAKPAVQRLGFAIQLKVYGLHRRFFESVREVPVEAIDVITPLIYPHVNPYGQFQLDLEQRIDFDRRLAA